MHFVKTGEEISSGSSEMEPGETKRFDCTPGKYAIRPAWKDEDWQEFVVELKPGENKEVAAASGRRIVSWVLRC